MTDRAGVYRLLSPVLEQRFIGTSSASQSGMLDAVAANHSDHVRLHVGGMDARDPEVDELVAAQRLGEDLYLVLGTPGLVYGCAAGDTVRVDFDGRFIVVERGGNVAAHLYAHDPLDEQQLQALRSRLKPLAGTVEGPPQGRFAVVTVPATAGFPAIEAALDGWTAAVGAEWFFGNVYDDEGTPLGWWETPG